MKSLIIIAIIYFAAIGVLHYIDSHTDLRPLEGGELPYLHYTYYPKSEKVVIRFHNDCYKISSSKENYTYMVCEELRGGEDE